MTEDEAFERSVEILKKFAIPDQTIHKTTHDEVLESEELLDLEPLIKDPEKKKVLQTLTEEFLMKDGIFENLSDFKPTKNN